MKNQRVTKARDIFRKKFYNNSYNGALHAILSFTLLFFFSVAPWFALSGISTKTILIYSGLFVFCTLVLYYQHRFPQHIPMKGFHFFYKIHRVHHSFFNYENMFVRNANDNLFILFPVSFILGYCLILFPIIASPFYYFFGLDIFLLACSSACFYFFCHEMIHYLGHTESNHFIYQNSFISFLREHHRIHHSDREEAVTNFNMILPFGDMLFETYQKEPTPLISEPDLLEDRKRA